MMERMMILTSSYRYGEDIRRMVDWSSINIEVVSVEYNGAIGLEQFAFFKPRIILLDSIVPIMGIDTFVEEMAETTNDFFVILLDDLHTSVSNIQNIYRVIDKNEINSEVLRQAVVGAVSVINKSFDEGENLSTEEYVLHREEYLMDCDFSIGSLRTLRDEMGITLTPQVTILMPRPIEGELADLPKDIRVRIRKLLNDYNGGEVFVNREGILCILINEIHDESKERVYNDLLLELRTLLKKHAPKWTFVLSDRIPLRKLNKEYASYCDLYEFGYFRSELSILKREYVGVRSLVENKYNEEKMLRKLINALCHEDEASVREVVAEIYCEYLKMIMDFDILSEWRLVAEVLYRTFAKIYAVEYDAITTEEIFSKRYNTIEREEEIIEMCFVELYRGMLKTDKKFNDIIYELIVIVLERYGEGLSLQSVADDISITTSYLSHLVKKEMDMTFSDYLAEIRMQIAKRMMKNPKVKIHEVALKVGYSDNRYFSRVFKKFEGISPSEYRSLILD